MSSGGGAVLQPKLVEKVWGRDSLPAPFHAPQGRRIGEIWFEPPPQLDDLLAKYLFTSEKLSVQVHPDDAAAPAGSRGKEECWLVLAAEEGARVAIGFQRELSAEELRVAAEDGSIEDLLAWHEVKPGDFFYLPAGTVHAIGAGLTIAELQQNSDVTYRLYDYGRPRELHLQEALQVAERGIYTDDRRRPVAPDRTVTLVDGPHFRLDHLVGEPGDALRAAYSKPFMVLPLAGEVTLDGGGQIPAGGCGWAEALDSLQTAPDARLLLLTTCG